MGNILHVDYRFFAVGQGLFSAGQITWTNNRPPFTWVFDCGTRSKQRLLTNAVGAFDAWMQQTNSEKIDILALSHFDEDHFNGVAPLLEKWRVDILMLPYLTLWQRLAAAFETGVGIAGNGNPRSQTLMPCFLNPTEYFTREGFNVGQVCHVVGDNNDGSPEMPYGPIRNSNTAPEIELEPRTGSQNAPDNQASREFRMYNGDGLRLGAIWKFVPYNDTNWYPRHSQSFRDAVVREQTALLGAGNPVQRNSALRRLRAVYDAFFGRTPEERNRISLFLLSRPVTPLSANGIRWRLRELDDNGSMVNESCGHQVAILHTGDGTLCEPPNRTKALESGLDLQFSARPHLLACLQVMHHGSKHSWDDEILSTFDPCHCVFSCNPSHYGHPDSNVQNACAGNGPIHVNQRQAWMRLTPCTRCGSL